MAVDVAIPAMGESVSEVVLAEWLKGDGEYVERDEALCVLETDKANVDLPAPAAGIVRHRQEAGAALEVGAVVAAIEEGERPAAAGAEAPPAAAPAAAGEASPPAAAPAAAGAEASPAAAPSAAGEAPPAAAPSAAESADGAKRMSPAARRLAEERGLEAAAIEGTGKGGRITKEDVLSHLAARGEGDAEEPAADGAAPEGAPAAGQEAAAGVRREPMSRLRQRIAQHLVAAQHNAAMLTTFNEIDMSAVMALRARYKERFAEVHGVSLGFMSFFARAAVLALREFPAVNAQIDGTDIVYRDYVNLGIAVSTERGLVVPVLRRVEQMSMAQIESEIKRLALGARDNRLAMDELGGGTFTITNGGVFGSLLSTPILNAPQSGILGMHAIQQRPVAVDGQVEIRPMMYVALSYDHRIIDGQQSVRFLVRIKELVEDPSRLMLEV